MASLGKYLRTQEGGQLAFWCPGCDIVHGVDIGPKGWKFNNDVERPTLHPSVLVRSGHFADGESAKSGSCWCRYNAEHPEDPVQFHCFQCHSFVTDGRIQFLNDSSHHLAGKTVDLPAFP